ncbi:dihydrolipoyl dehydrogenase [Desulfobulbus rhabdoformis]|uniref:dihydrolipoyl dehydrogenase n=1 Tax=Desulfobulbus rhabdoformis TaxID=34032 RepID=UPI0019643D10|nr:dihydrolipoyl dehydrogenase [Desulfobulbus rhabdoformis]MBM9615373.1 dihydrolipoyl dehydrogenase [Desulfobulbus rhabdoformis]
MQEVKTGVAVIGGGPGGYTAAFRAADLGLHVCLIEQGNRLGGTCLNVGCIPSKTLLHAADVIEEASEAAKFGVTFSSPEIDLSVLRSHKADVVSQLTKGLDTLCKARNIDRRTGTATFTGSHTLAVRGQEESTQVHFDQAIIATGSQAFKLPGIPEDPRIWDSTTALALTTIPKRLLIIGGGIIGLEMAQIYHALGTEITIVEMQKQLIPPADRDLVQPLFLKLKKRYSIHTDTRVGAITPQNDGVEVSLEGKNTSTQRYDAVLVAVGRRPHTADLGLAALPLEPNDKGFIPVNQQQQTRLPHIYAIGDVVGDPMLAHKATHQGKIAAEVIAGHQVGFTPKIIPSVAYTAPEIAWAGLTEKEAQEQGISLDKGKFPWGASGRALSSGANLGVSKALFDTESGVLLGAGICGANAGELIHEAALAIELGATARQISSTIHAHPTLAETFAFAAEMVDGSITDVLPPKPRRK